MPEFENELKLSKNPYLLQHKNNPVAWRIWGTKPFEEARRRNVPILVSIGYSTCHWCHVMAHEVFEKQEAAQRMNENLVCIKVDREEHPEVDEVYMEACQTMNGSGGWPLNVFLDTDGKPFFAVTYLPHKEWNELIDKIMHVWNENRKDIDDFANHLSETLQNNEANEEDITPDNAITNLYAYLEQYFDSENPDFSGKGRAPRFPSHALYYFLLSRRQIPVHIASMLEQTLEAIQDSGLHDRVGGGFHRYSTDVSWRVPHFEKMLYDNAQLMAVFAMASSRFGRKDFLNTARNIANYLIQEESVYENNQFAGFASAEDADDPVGEGSFYAWTMTQLENALGKAKGNEIAQQWNITDDSKNIHGVYAYRIPHPRGSQEFNSLLAEEKMQQRLSWESIYSDLINERNTRPRPFRDSKVLTDWNALALMGFAVLYAHAPDSSFKNIIDTTAQLIVKRFKDDTLYRLPDKRGHLTDYGHTALALFTAWEVTGNPEYIDISTAITRAALDKFTSTEGKLYTSEKDTGIFMQYEEKYDHAHPAGAHTLLLAWVRLHAHNRLPEYTLLINQIVKRKTAQVMNFPVLIPMFLCVLEELQNGPLTLSFPAGNRDSGGLLQWTGTEIRLVPEKDAKNYQFCEKDKCLLPVSSVSELEDMLKFKWR